MTIKWYNSDTYTDDDLDITRDVVFGESEFYNIYIIPNIMIKGNTSNILGYTFNISPRIELNSYDMMKNGTYGLGYGSKVYKSIASCKSQATKFVKDLEGKY